MLLSASGKLVLKEAEMLFLAYRGNVFWSMKNSSILFCLRNTLKLKYGIEKTENIKSISYNFCHKLILNILDLLKVILYSIKRLIKG